MIDPITAAAMATKAYAGVRAFIEAGKSIEDTFQVVALLARPCVRCCTQVNDKKNAQIHLSKLFFLARWRPRRHRCLPQKSA